MSLVGSLKPLLAEPAWEGEEVRSLPEGFVYLDEVIPDAIYEVRYYTDYNLSAAGSMAIWCPGSS